MANDTPFKFGLFTSWFCFFCSCLTLVLGVLYIILRLGEQRIHFGGCDDVIDIYCNRPWRQLVTFDPETLMDVWTPVILGVLGILLHFPEYQLIQIISWFLPSTYAHYGVMMIITAFFANFGYCGQYGVLLGCLTLLGALLCFIVFLVGQHPVILIGGFLGQGVSAKGGGLMPSIIGNRQDNAHGSSSPRDIWGTKSTKLSWPSPFGLQGVRQWHQKIKRRTPAKWVARLRENHLFTPGERNATVVTVHEVEPSLNYRVGSLSRWDAREEVYHVRLCTVEDLNKYLETGVGPQFLGGVTKFKAENLMLFDLEGYRNS